MEIGTEKITGLVKLPAKKEIKNVPLLKKTLEASLSKTTTEIVEIIVGGSISLDASDIHLEPEEEKVKLRARVDGVLQEIIEIDKKVYKGILSRIKLLSGIKLNITDRAQDGRFTASLEELPIEIRVSTIPTEYGESIVMRLLNPKKLIDLEQLGLRSDLLEIFKEEIKKTTGMIIVTGPTGSGKTTTLYAFLKKIRNPEIKIITIEDPVEYRLEGITQTQVEPAKGYTFANGLRAIVRQDPDVILVGEIRDGETANIAIQAALTGHLVLSTLHTNDAAGTIARLVNLGVKPYDIGPALNMIVAQRLVRKVCKKCKKEREASEKELEKMKRFLGNLPSTVKIPKIEKGLKIAQPVGCEDCNFTGFKGRCGIYEIILFDDEMEKFILKEQSIAALREKAKEKGMVTMYQDGLIKVLEGITSIEEVERVVS
jgi:type II secretory ATPase GspE/PulE/Tfp pilus assembly ATPase PilB-like protein